MRRVCVAALVLLVSMGAAMMEDEVPFLPENHVVGSSGAVDAAVRRSFEAVRVIMREGEPVLDPHKIDHYVINIDVEDTRLVVNIDDVTVMGHSNYSVDGIKADLEDLRAMVNLSIPHMEISGRYEIQGEAGQVTGFFGDGPFTLGVEDIVVQSMFQLSQQEVSAQLQHINLDISVKKVQAEFKNLLGGGVAGELLNHLLSERGADFLEEHMAGVASYVSAELSRAVNPLLGRLTLSQLLEAMGVQRP